MIFLCILHWHMNFMLTCFSYFFIFCIICKCIHIFAYQTYPSGHCILKHADVYHCLHVIVYFDLHILGYFSCAHLSKYCIYWNIYSYFKNAYLPIFSFAYLCILFAYMNECMYSIFVFCNFGKYQLVMHMYCIFLFAYLCISLAYWHIFCIFDYADYICMYVCMYVCAYWTYKFSFIIFMHRQLTQFGAFQSYKTSLKLCA